MDVFERQHFYSGSVGSAGFNLILFLVKVFQTDTSLFLYLFGVYALSNRSIRHTIFNVFFF